MKFNRRFAGGAQRYVRIGADGQQYECVVFLDHRLGCPHLHFGDPEADDCGCGSLAELRARDLVREERSANFRRRLGRFLRR
ncbi:MAG: hypothetical protein VX685_00635 [Actinomycetota bacterium]|jgi:hypothetical protein|nr:hypothetical protein [Acidimicrobiales bacterium]MED6303527.1 hypothetical protein [Actinomycetota bacterium]